MTLAGLLLIVTGIALALYAYLVYPLLLAVVARIRSWPVRAADPAEWPMLSITVPAYNEAHAIGGTLDALLATDYPADRRQILVVSDASTDGTDDVVRGYADRGVELLRVEQRGGKTAAENAARERLRGSIIINTDASVRIAAGALKPLVRCFADPEVGVASGRDVSVTRHEHDVNVGESQYVGYEMWLRDLETRVGYIVGASGCFYGVRHQLHMTIVPEALSRDFAAALVAREHGYRAVSVHDAVCFVPRIGSLRREYRRKLRTMTRGLETLFFKRHLLNPWRYGRFAWMLASHKLIRWLVPWGFVLAALGTVLVSFGHPQGWVLVAALVATLVLAAVGWCWPEERQAPSLVAVPAFLVSGTIAAIKAWLRAMRGELNPIWEPTRRAPIDPSLR